LRNFRVQFINMKSIKIISALIALTPIFAGAQASDSAFKGNLLRSDYMTGALSSGFFPITKFDASPSVKPLSVKKLEERDIEFAKRAEKFFDDDGNNLAMMMLDHGKIIYERYASGVDQDSKMFSWSMAKSLTAYTVGEALCSGKIKSLNDQAESYTPEIKDSAYGKATIKQLLTMSSGAPPGPPEYMGSQKDEWMNLTRGFKSITEMLNLYGARTENPGVFAYKNMDTDALVLAVNGNGNFKDLFATTIWNRAGTEKSATWLVDKTGTINGSFGLGATLRDWARLALESLEMRNGTRGKCIQEFMMDATTKQIANEGGGSVNFYHYGYQTWIDPREQTGIYVWLGAYGQKVMIDPKNERILILFRHANDMKVNQQFGRLYCNWANCPPATAEHFKIGTKQ
jgi:CubicO group peptidase (beta-lactamase class C family)